MKVIPKHRIASYAAVQLVMREIDVHAHIDHPNSVRLYQVLQSQTDLFLVMGYAGVPAFPSTSNRSILPRARDTPPCPAIGLVQ